MPMDIKDLTHEATELLSVKRVFGEPFEKDGLTIIPAASFQGGGGGGEAPEGQGSGGGFGVNAHPAGAYVIDHGTVSWQPAIDRSRLALAAAAVAIVALLTIRSIVKARLRVRALKDLGQLARGRRGLRRGRAPAAAAEQPQLQA
jgi:uncharacterized spore protein YtfJ